MASLPVCARTGRLQWLLCGIGLLFATAAPPAHGLDLEPREECTVQVLNQTVRVAPDGSWRVSNIPALGLQVRVRAYCQAGLRQRSGQSDFVVLKPGQNNAVASLKFGGVTAGPTRLVTSAVQSTLTQVGQTMPIQLVGQMRDGATRDLSAAATGTTWTSTNGSVATVSAAGLVTAKSSGVVLISAVNDGVSVGVVLTVRVGGDTDGDGLPDDYETRVGLNPVDPTDGLSDSDADGLTNLSEYQAGTNPFAADTDSDGLLDGEEVQAGADGFVTSPTLTDTDGDLVSDPLELTTGTDPTSSASVNFDAALSRIEIKPGSVVLADNPIAGESSVRLRLIGVAIDGTGLDLTAHPLVQWTSDKTSVAGFGLIPGELFAGSAGKTTVRATFGAKSASASVVTTSFAPKPLAALKLGCPGRAVQLDRDWAYVACDTTGVRTVSLGIPTAPAIAATVPTSGAANDLYVGTNAVWVAGGEVVALDKSAPWAPTRLSTLTLPAAATTISGSGNVGVVGAGTGLYTLDLTEPTAPGELGTVALTGAIRDVAADGPLAAAVLASGTLVLVDISEPTSPVVWTNTSPISLGARSVVLMDGRADLAIGNSGLALVNVTTPGAPTVLSTIGPGSFMLSDAARVGNLVFGADYYRVNSVPIVQTALASSPVFSGVVEFSSYSDDNGLAVAADETHVAMLGAPSPASPATLYFGQYRELFDSGTVAPECIFGSPTTAVTAVDGVQIVPRIIASDDVYVHHVDFTVDGVVVATDTSPPFEMAVPMAGVGPHTLSATAYDLAGNVGACPNLPVTLEVDPLTTLVGSVVDSVGAPVGGALVTLVGTPMSATTAADGAFELPGAPTPNPVRLAVVGESAGYVLTDDFGPFTALPAAVTDVGVLVLKTYSSKRIMATVSARPAGFTTNVFGTLKGSVTLGTLSAAPVGFITNEFNRLATSTTLGVVVAAPVGFISNVFDELPSATTLGALVAAPAGFATDLFDELGGSATLGVLSAQAAGFVTDVFDELGGSATIGAVAAAPAGFITDLFGGGLSSTTLGVVVARPVGFYARPVVTWVTPTQASASQGPVGIVVSGLGLAGATGVQLYTAAGALVASVTSSAVENDPDSVDPTHPDVMATLTFGAPVLAPGKYTLVVTASAGTTTTIQTTENSFTITP